jgi:pimeloyl-ACP methyl ester carboxylesterase
MNITDNLKKDISNAPEWFQDAIVSESEVKVLEAELGNVSYKCWGKGTNDKTIVLIHGTGASKNWWDPIAPFISDEYRVIAPDLPGMGDSDHREEYSYEVFGESILSILEQENISNNVFLVGHSLGGHIAGFVATEKPSKISGIIMIDTPVRPPDYEYDKHVGSGPLRLIKYYPDKKTILGRFRLMPKQECENDWYLRYVAEYSVKQTEEGWRWKFGGKSLLMGSKILEYMKSTFKENMEFISIDHAAHHVPIDAPKEVIKIIKKTIDKWL